VWNWSIEFNRSTIYLNVDHPILRISWADALNSVCVFALNCLVLGLWIDRQNPSSKIVQIASIAAILTNSGGFTNLTLHSSRRYSHCQAG
jgi:hypothetical protein